MLESEIHWNEEARAKILDDADAVLREAVLDLGRTRAGQPWEDVFAELNGRMKDRFIDFEPGPDLRKYAEAVANGEFGTGAGTESGAAQGDAAQVVGAQTDTRVNGIEVGAEQVDDG